MNKNDNVMYYLSLVSHGTTVLYSVNLHCTRQCSNNYLAFSGCQIT